MDIFVAVELLCFNLARTAQSRGQKLKRLTVTHLPVITNRRSSHRWHWLHRINPIRCIFWPTTQMLKWPGNCAKFKCCLSWLIWLRLWGIVKRTREVYWSVTQHSAARRKIWTNAYNLESSKVKYWFVLWFKKKKSFKVKQKVILKSV